MTDHASDRMRDLKVASDEPSFQRRLAIDCVAALSAAFCVSPFITVVDRSIILNASGAQPLTEALKAGVKQFFTKPHTFFRGMDFRLIWGLYTATYVVANVVDTVCARKGMDSSGPKFVCTTAVNGSLCIAKDRSFTRMFGTIAPSNLPIGSYGLFAVRDMMTIGASFSLPSKISTQLQNDHGWDKNTANISAQMACPMLVQFLSTPMHLLGLDLYNNKSTTFSARVGFIKREYLKSTLARICRIGPAFGVGGVSNKYFRDSLLTRD
eukprot:CFRG1322T1